MSRIIKIFLLTGIFLMGGGVDGSATVATEVSSPVIQCDHSEEGNPEAVVGTFAEMLDFRDMARLKRWRTCQGSGYDRDGGFYDSGNFLRVEEGPRYVLMEQEVAGCIDRMWFTYKSEVGKEPYDLVIYVDDRETPVIQVDLDQLFSSRFPPFVEPLADCCGREKTPGRYCYVPIGFQEYCKVVLVPKGPSESYQYRRNSRGEKIPHIYYQITYRRLEPGVAVRRFRWSRDAEEMRDLRRLQALWWFAGSTPWPEVKDIQTRRKQIEVKPGSEAVLYDEEGMGVIYGIEVKVARPEGLRFEIRWDHRDEADVSVPFGPFFGCAEAGMEGGEVSGLFFGHEKGKYYSYWPLPFRRRARISVHSQGSEATVVEAEVQIKHEQVREDDGYFCAQRYDYGSVSEGEDYTVLDCRGRGHFVGLVMDRPGNMEGDDRFFVDGEVSPSVHGSGTEDFFNFAWGLSHTGSFPLHGITVQSGAPICYRIHPPGVPFRKHLTIRWEHGHDVQGGSNRHQGRYSGVVFYYLYDSLIDVSTP